MNNLILGQVLGGLFGNARQRRAGGGGLGGGLGGGGLGGGGLGGAALGSVLGGMLAGRRGGRGGLGGNRTVLLAMLLPYAMRWVQRNGGLGAVLQRAQAKGFGKQAQSWVSTGQNEPLDAQAVDGIVDDGEVHRLAQELGVDDVEVKQGFAEILPEMVNQLTPDGRVTPEADDVLHESVPLLERELQQAQETTPH